MVTSHIKDDISTACIRAGACNGFETDQYPDDVCRDVHETPLARNHGASATDSSKCLCVTLNNQFKSDYARNQAMIHIFRGMASDEHDNKYTTYAHLLNPGIKPSWDALVLVWSGDPDYSGHPSHLVEEKATLVEYYDQYKSLVDTSPIEGQTLVFA
nr:AlNc14C291G10245 [Albugo laibachii Nc14]|eukprot:CCA25339.1 AlNc14C291G10245 [Albugo laibachii Nc14]